MKQNRVSRRRTSFFQFALTLLALALGLSALRAQILPPPPAPDKPHRLSTQPSLFVRGYVFEGNTAFSHVELSKLTAAYANRELGTADLEEARRAVSLYYVAHGYINSGASIPDQDPVDGMIRMTIVEGELTKTDLHGNRWLRDDYIRNQLRRWSTRPLNLNTLQEGLQLLRQNPNVNRISAELKPGTAPGESLLDLKVEDRQPLRLGLQIDNQRPPSVGAEELWLLASDLNLTGHSDPLEFKYGLLNSSANGFEPSGADNLEGTYSFPLTRFGTTLGLHGSRLNTSIVEDTFASLDIESLTTSYGLSVRQVVHQTANQEAAISIGLDHRENTSRLLGEPFNLSPGAVDGETVVSVLRFSQEWIRRGPSRVLALRSTFNFGLDLWDATENGIPGDPDGKFFYWLGQGQYVQRLFNTQNELLFRISGQWSAERLLALEQMSAGGYETVRGYLENQLVRDRGVVSSVEFRLPVLYNKAGAGIVHLAPFFDVGTARNVASSQDLSTIYSAGVGLLLAPCKRFSAQLYWGYRLQHVHVTDEAGGQGLGLSFKININAF